MPNENIVDKLSIEVVSQASNATDQLSKVVGELERLKSVLSGIKMPNMGMGLKQDTADNLKKLANVIYGLKTDKLKEFGEVASGISFKIGINDKTADNLIAFNDSIKAFDSNKLKEFAQVASTVPKLNLGVNAETGLNLRSLAAALEAFPIPRLAELGAINKHYTPINIGAKADTGDNLRSVGSALTDFPIPKLAELGAINKHFTKLNIGNIQADTGNNLRSLGQALTTFPIPKLAELGAINKYYTKLQLGITANTAKSLSEFGVALGALNLQKLRDLAAINFSNLKPLTDAGRAMRGFSSQLSRLENATKKAEKAQKELATATRSVHRETKTSTHHFNLANTALGRFLNSIKRIAFYRMIRSALKSLTQGFAEGIENLYYWSQAWDTSFAPKMDQLATAQLYLKNGFSSMFAPLIEYAIPIIDRVIDKLVDMFNVAQELFAKLTGAPTWNKAIKYPVTYKDALDDAAGSAKALQNILMDFDELNVINTPKSGSRGKAGDEKDYAAMFQLMETATGNNPLGKFGSFFEDVGGKVEEAFGTLKKYVSFFTGLNFTPMQESLGNLWDNTLSPILDELNKDAAWLESEVLEPITKFLVEKGVPAAIDTLSSAISMLWSVFKPLKDGVKTFWDQNGKWIMDFSESQFITAMEKLKESFEAIGTWVNKNQRINKLFESMSSIVRKLAPFILPIIELISSDAWTTFVDQTKALLDILDPILDSVVGLLELLDGILGFDFDKIDGGINDVGRSILKSITAPLTIVLDLFAKMAEGFAEFAYSMGWKKIGDNCKETAEGARYLAEQIRSGADAFELVEEEANSTYHGIDKGNKGAGESFIVLKKEGVEVFDSLFATAANDSAKTSKAWNDSTSSISKGLDNLPGKSDHVFTRVSSVGSKASQDLISAFTSALSPNAGLDLGQRFGKAIGDGANGAGIGWSVGAQIAASIQAALTAHGAVYIPVEAQFTNANYNQLVNMTKQQLRGMGISITGFATGGFPTPGSLFTAGEIPGQTEILGTIGGRTAVAGGEEITGIREAVYESGQRQETLLRSLISAVQNKDLTLVANSATGRWVNKALKAYSGVTG